MSKSPQERILEADRLARGGLRFTLSGDGEPLLLIHGAYIQDALAPVARHRELAGLLSVFYHRRGYGGSVGHDGQLSIQQEAQDAIALLDELSIEKVHVAGYSSGGVVAYRLATAFPDRIASLSMIEPALQAPGAGERGLPPFLAEAFAAYQAGDVERAVDAFWSAVSNPNWRTAIRKGLPEGVDQLKRNAHIFFELEAPAVVAFPFLESEAISISQPMQLLIGDASVPRSADLRAVLHQWIPHTREVLIRDADHALPMQQPEQIAAAIAGFVRANPID